MRQLQLLPQLLELQHRALNDDVAFDQGLRLVADWLTFYNQPRLHSTLGYISPMKYA